MRSPGCKPSTAGTGTYHRRRDGSAVRSSSTVAAGRRPTWPSAEPVHLPVRASWLNQVGIYFSIVQRRVVEPQDFADLDVLTTRLLAFQDRYNATAGSFN